MIAPRPIAIGLDVGSTTVKLTVVNAADAVCFQQYRRHETRQAETALSLLRAAMAAVDDAGQGYQCYLTGSGSGPLLEALGAVFVQEVNAVTAAAESRFPDVGSVVELGGQDAKVIIFKEDPSTGRRNAIPSMNDKCASGTGATLDKCALKVGMPAEDMARLTFDPERIHPVAAKCGVFAETDIVNLIKTGIPRAEIMNSLADAIIGQNLSVLCRGNTLRSRVLLLGGPNTFLPFLQQCWRLRIQEVWTERKVPEATEVDPLDAITVPDQAEYFACLGAVRFGRMQAVQPQTITDLSALEAFITTGREDRLQAIAGPALTAGTSETDDFVGKYRLPPFQPEPLVEGSSISGYVGIDGGSTSSKLVFVDENGRLLQKLYRLSEGNPIADMQFLFGALRQWATEQGSQLHVRGFGVTGYAGNILAKGLRADVNIVETIAHSQSALSYFPDADVVCDIGGQDIKLLYMQDGQVRDFKLSNQCSAGNGMLLQAMADQFGIAVTDYAEHAFDARLAPEFSYGCAVFLDADRVNFQKEGFASSELLAGLARVLPKNIWQYVGQQPRLGEHGRTFVLQGGTQYNLAAVKAQVDYIVERIPDARVHVHPYPGEAGAIGAAMEAARVTRSRGSTSFIDVDAAIGLHHHAYSNEDTRCRFCANNCSRTFIDMEPPGSEPVRHISGFSCEKGTVEDKAALKRQAAERRQRAAAAPNLVADEAREAFRWTTVLQPMPEYGDTCTVTARKRSFWGGTRLREETRPFQRAPVEAWHRRAGIRIGMPRVLNMWSTAPFWKAFFTSLGIPLGNLVFSSVTSERLTKAGSKYGDIDPCFPSKVAQAHIHDLLNDKHGRKPLDAIFFPCLTHVPTFVEGVMDTACCPIVAGTPKVMLSAFTKEQNYFADKGVQFIHPTLTLTGKHLLVQQLLSAFGPLLELAEDECRVAVNNAFTNLDAFQNRMQERGREVLDQVSAHRYEQRSLIVTSNHPFGEWNQIFGDQAMTIAAIDRLVHHSIIFELNTDSYRRKAALKAQRQTTS